jgi:uncharacterized protein (DUF2141 family)
MNLNRALNLLLLAAAGPAFAKTSPPGCTKVEVHPVRPRQGHLMVAAYGSAESFGKKPLAALRLPAGDRMTFQLCDLAGDSVALTLFQDLDSDGQMARNLMGIPTEPWGSSGTAGPLGPSWSGGAVALDARVIVVKMSS